MHKQDRIDIIICAAVCVCALFFSCRFAVRHCMLYTFGIECLMSIFALPSRPMSIRMIFYLRAVSMVLYSCMRAMCMSVCRRRSVSLFQFSNAFQSLIRGYGNRSHTLISPYCRKAKVHSKWAQKMRSRKKYTLSHVLVGHNSCLHVALLRAFLCVRTAKQLAGPVQEITVKVKVLTLKMCNNCA